MNEIDGKNWLVVFCTQSFRVLYLLMNNQTVNPVFA